VLPKHAKSVVPCRAVPYLCAYLLMTTHSILAFMETQRGVHGTCMMLQPDACGSVSMQRHPVPCFITRTPPAAAGGKHCGVTTGCTYESCMPGELGCHKPIMMLGRSPREVTALHKSYILNSTR
jgi:hypothetical protein